MIVLAGIVLVVVVIAAMAAGRSASGRRAGGPSAPGAQPPPPGLLDRAVGAGIITADQANAIAALESPPAGAGAPPPPLPSARRVPIVAEILGYLGAVLAIVGVMILVGQFWDRMASWSRLSLLGVAAVALWAAGATLDEDADPALWRLRQFLWLLSAGALAGFTGVLCDQVFSWIPQAVVLAIGLVTATYGALLWRLHDRPAQQVTVVGGLVAVIVGALAWRNGAGAVGLGLWGLGVLWTALGLADLLPPRLVAVALGPALVLVGAGVTGASWESAAPILGLTSAAALLAVGVARRTFVVTGLGVVGIFVYLPWTAGRFFANTIGVPIILVATGAALLVVTLLLLRRHGGTPSGQPRPSWH
ncbi:MAG TPA: DUF2157 domain-containing protein [Acidimicrobiales bacterium]|nr:DUF2157 domain-containing protein [Acidimicrobiales bacterium]